MFFVKGGPKQELVLLPTMKMIASGVIPELDLVLEVTLMTTIRVETRPSGDQIMETSTLERCVMFLYNKNLAKRKWLLHCGVYPIGLGISISVFWWL